LVRDLVVSASVLQWMLIFPVYPRWLAVQHIDGTSKEMKANTQQRGVSEILINIHVHHLSLKKN